jgi:enolase
VSGKAAERLVKMDNKIQVWTDDIQESNPEECDIQIQEKRWNAIVDGLNDQVVALREKVAYLENALNKARIERDLLLDIVKK